MLQLLGLVLVGVGFMWMSGLCVVLVRADRQQQEHLRLAVPAPASRMPRHCRRSVWAMVWAMTWAGTA